MGDPVAYKVVIRPLWHVVKEVRDKVEAILAHHGEELSYAGKMVASELVENAVKYGVAIDPEAAKGIEFEINVSDADVTIAVTNRTASQKDLANARQHIDAIHRSGDPQQLYVQRLTNLMENPGQDGSQLGLYRIAYEGGFDLAYELADDIITIRARRKIA